MKEYGILSKLDKPTEIKILDLYDDIDKDIIDKLLIVKQGTDYFPHRMEKVLEFVEVCMAAYDLPMFTMIVDHTINFMKKKIKKNRIDVTKSYPEKKIIINDIIVVTQNIDGCKIIKVGDDVHPATARQMEGIASYFEKGKVGINATNLKYNYMLIIPHTVATILIK